MASRTRQAADFVGAGVAAGLGWKVGAGLLPVLGGLLLALLLWLTVQLESVQEALVVLGLLIGGAVALVRWRRQVARQVRQLLNPPGTGGTYSAAPGCTYEVLDDYGMVRYDGSSGDVDDLLARLRAHLIDGDPRRRTAVTGKVRPGWSIRIRFENDRDTAYRVEGERIEERLGTPGYLNRRREGRGQ